MADGGCMPDGGWMVRTAEGAADPGAGILEGAGMPREAGRPGAGDELPERWGVMSRDSLEAGEAWPAILGLAAGAGDAERDEPPASDVTRAMPVVLALAAARVARRFASISLAEVGRASMTACSVRDSPWSCSILHVSLVSLVNA